MLGSRNLIIDTSNTVRVLSGQLSQVRYRRTLAYPFYSKPGNIPPARKGKKQTVFKRLMDEFLGPKNYKGDYYLNKYSYPKTNHSTNYIDPRGERGEALLQPVDELEAEGEESFDDSRGGRRRNQLQPFPLNFNCATNLQISKDTKHKIVDDILLNKLPSQQVALKYGLKIQRIEAILKLRQIEEHWEQEGLIKSDLKKMEQTMYKMFPLYNSEKNSENLTEIPIPKETLQSRFLTIAESEPFGPVDAAKEFDLEPAAITLQRLSEGGAHSAHATPQEAIKKDGSFISKMYEGDKFAIKFTPVKVGKVGYTYGKVNRDNRKDRKVGYNAAGKMVYSL